jgi:hypothetical protein
MRPHTTTRFLGSALLVALTVSVVLHSSHQTLAQESPQDKLFAEVKAAWKKREDQAKTLRIEWTSKNLTPKGSIDVTMPMLAMKGDKTKSRPQKDTTHEGKSQLVLDQMKARLQLEQFVWHEPSLDFVVSHTDSAFDQKACTQSVRLGSSPSEIITVNKANWVTGCDVTTWPICMAFRGHQPEVMEGQDISKHQVARESTLNGRRVIEVIRERNENRGEIRLWLDPSQDFSVIRHDEYARNGNLTFQITVQNIKHSLGIWIPSEWTTMVYSGKVLIRRVQTTVRKVSFNDPVDPAEFELVPGTKAHVIDYTGEKTREYITREGKPNREILPSERGSDYVDLERTEKGELGTREDFGFLRRNWVYLLAGTGFLVVLFASLFTRKRLKVTSSDSQPSNPT